MQISSEAANYLAELNRKLAQGQFDLALLKELGTTYLQSLGLEPNRNYTFVPRDDGDYDVEPVAGN